MSVVQATVAWSFLFLSLVGAAYTFNAYVPIRRVRVLFVLSFFAGWLTAELALQHIVLQAIGTAVFIALGALSIWPGQLGLAITVVSWLGLFGLYLESRKARRSFDDALADLPQPENPQRLPVSHIANPFLHRRRGVRVEKDVIYRKVAGRKLKLDVVLPREPGHGRPAIIQIHGGAWIVGSKREQGWPLLGHLAANGWVGFNVNYRLSPAATWPAHIEDVKYALKWIRERADDYGIDPNFVAVTGGSAGGHLTSLMGLTANDPEYQRGFEGADTTVQAAVPVYGVFDFTNRLGTQVDMMRSFLLEKLVMKRFFDRNLEAYRRASPIDRVHPGAPPFLVVHGNRDTLAPVRDARLFVETLSTTSNSGVYYAELPGAQHAFDLFNSPRLARMLDGVLRFLEAERQRAQKAEPIGVERETPASIRAAASS